MTTLIRVLKNHWFALGVILQKQRAQRWYRRGCPGLAQAYGEKAIRLAEKIKP